jgi:hypothetical protein
MPSVSTSVRQYAINLWGISRKSDTQEMFERKFQTSVN